MRPAAPVWTPERLQELRRLRSAGLGWAEVGARLMVTPDSARSALARAPETVQQIGQSVSPGQGSDPLLARPTSQGSSVLDALSPPPVQVKETGPVLSAAPAVHTSKSRAENYLIISDTQLPYHHPGALEFCKRVRHEFAVPLENVLHVGDEFDQAAFSRFPKTASMPHTALQELEECRKEVARWAAAFPDLRICYSNHGGRLAKLAEGAGIPASMLRDLREIYGLPEGWRYAEFWHVRASKLPFRVEHGHARPGGHSGLRLRPQNRGMPVAWGHEHAEPATLHVDTYGGQQLWGMRVGSLIRREAVAFDYAAHDGSRAVGSVGVVLDGGRTPLIVRL